MLMFWFGLAIGVAGASLSIVWWVVGVAARASKVTSRQEEMHAETVSLLTDANGYRDAIAHHLRRIAIDANEKKE